MSRMENACPECRDGKHRNCDGISWDVKLDVMIECPCSQAGHPA